MVSSGGTNRRNPACIRDPASIKTSDLNPRFVLETRLLFETRLVLEVLRYDIYWQDQEIIYDLRAQLQGTGSRSDVFRYRLY